MVQGNVVFPKHAKKDARKTAHPGVKLQAGLLLKFSMKIPIKLPRHRRSPGEICPEHAPEG